ncbi:hypothetical protein Zmor_027790 [Zophobas morio]|uniref:Cytochrome P450 n=1 Tax=Zophobas morio TaxID=2755281 RepID=A0AA38HPB0_9CUCU|nr:hypothetical protein Zmor_027790 [Zophobas morio]
MSRLSRFCTISDALICVTAILVLRLILTFVWNRRWLYYHGSKFPGPVAFPLIGNMYLLEDVKKIHATICKYYDKYAPIGRFWIDTLYVCTSKAEYVEKVFTRCLDKGILYDIIADDYFKDTIIFAPLSVWKKQRKVMDHFFKPNVVNCFASIFIREARRVTENLEVGKPVDLFLNMWNLGTNAACETIGGVHPKLLTGKKQSVRDVLRFEEIVLKRFFNPLYFFKYFWDRSSYKNEIREICQRAHQFAEKMVDENESLKKITQDGEKRLLSHLIHSNHENQFSYELLLRIASTLLPISSETTAVGASSVLLMLGMHPEVQEKVSEELQSVFGHSDRDATLEDLSQLDYLDRVIKESLRLFPPLPLIGREINRNFALDPYVLPAGCRFVVLVQHIHRNPEYWSEPLKFDPDRFLPEETAKRNRFAYIPFSIGSRNCPGSRYAMLSMKATLATVLRRYKIAKVMDYRSVEEIELTFSFVGKASKGYRVVLEKKCQS